jgi:hypothetical protein
MRYAAKRKQGRCSERTENMSISSKDMYTEASQTIRHYSTCVMRIRFLSIAQGFVIISASYFLVKDQQFILCSFLSLLGVILTYILHIHTNGYRENLWAFLDYAVNLERTHQANMNSNNEHVICSAGPWILCRDRLEDRYRSKHYTYTAVYGHLAMLYLSMFFAMIVGIAGVLGFVGTN